jgi:hypothetical protein
VENLHRLTYPAALPTGESLTDRDINGPASSPFRYSKYLN